MKRFLLKLWTAIRNFFCPKKSDMKIFNKVVWGKVAPENKNDIWFDGSTFRHYKNDDWFPMTLTKEEVQEMLKSIEVKSVTPDWRAEVGEEGFIKNRTHYLSNKMLHITGEFSEYVGENYTLWVKYGERIWKLSPGESIGILYGADDYTFWLDFSSDGALSTRGGSYGLEYPIEIYEYLIPIPSAYLPDSILWTINPIIVKKGGYIPNDAFDIIYDHRENKWLPAALNTCVLEIPTDEGVMYTKITSIQGNVAKGPTVDTFTINNGYVE